MRPDLVRGAASTSNVVQFVGIGPNFCLATLLEFADVETILFPSLSLIWSENYWFIQQISYREALQHP